jgi:hypothetical protein
MNIRAQPVTGIPQRYSPRWKSVDDLGESLLGFLGSEDVTKSAIKELSFADIQIGN